MWRGLLIKSSTGEAVHFCPFEEANINLGVYPKCWFPDLAPAYSAEDLPSSEKDYFTGIIQFDTNTFAHRGYCGDGPALVMVSKEDNFLALTPSCRT